MKSLLIAFGVMFGLFLFAEVSAGLVDGLALAGFSCMVAILALAIYRSGWIKSTIRVQRHVSKRDSSGHQLLLKEWRILDTKFWTSTIDREDVPPWASIQVAESGRTTWRSKFIKHLP